MSDKKYLGDGRKVVVIGKLNNEESIVQEIFVTESGDEIPSGERFTVKNLHDEPMLSYKEKSAKQAEEKLKDLNNQIEQTRKKVIRIKSELQGHEEILRSSQKLIEKLPEKEFETLTALMAGTIKYVVSSRHPYDKPPIPFDEKLIKIHNEWGRHSFNGLRLVSVYGKSKGEITYKINQYPDGSGIDESVHLFTSHEEALAFVKDQAVSDHAEGKLGVIGFIKCLEMGIEFSSEMRKYFRQKVNAQMVEKETEVFDNANRIVERNNAQFDEQLHIIGGE